MEVLSFVFAIGFVNVGVAYLGPGSEASEGGRGFSRGESYVR